MHGTNKNLVCKKEEIKCNNIIKQYKNKNIIDAALPSNSSSHFRKNLLDTM